MESLSTEENSGLSAPLLPLPSSVSTNTTDIMHDDETRSYIAMAVPLLHVLRQQHTSQAAAVARQIVQRWGPQAGPVGELVKLLEAMEREKAKMEEEEDNEDEEEESCTSSTEDSEESDGVANNNNSGGGDVLQTLQQIIEQLPPAGAKNRTEINQTSVGATTITTNVGDLENETEEERRIFDGIAGAVEREMKRLAVVRKHR
ncbi:hypothetical protein LSM04_006735 [Trypanosoma melophagium]|uniref:uncharacterized protein n=1 Tax=Trypanosoma melophagium TaxID=715481 RepID=UPI00351A37B8|nr:hypothetical protein LSM04_006735 [Trypanosoma melophagium]